MTAQGQPASLQVPEDSSLEHIPLSGEFEMPRPARQPRPRKSAPPERVALDGKVFRRGAERFRVRGATYGPFAPNRAGEFLPEPAAAAADFARMHALGLNALRIYHAPPGWLLDLAEEWQLSVLMDVPCPKHLDFLEDLRALQGARAKVAAALKATGRRGILLAASVGNEIPPDVVRWYGPKRISKFLSELADAARQADPGCLLTYGNFPPTEYLELPFLDFPTFNVYLHDRIKFRRYLLRLANRVGDRPLLLGEIGMDTLRHGEEAQAKFLGGHIREAALLGIAGTFVFAWTDDWHVHGHRIEDWAFGITRADRTPKMAYVALGKLFRSSPATLFRYTPRVSVVVCSYNGARTLEQCLQSLEALDYPDYEVILVDDGSTDHTPSIASRFPNVRTIRQANRGLSAARNVGLEAAAGEIVAYTDSDCFADPDWLGLLMRQFDKSGAVAVGGPNLTPEDGWLAGCVAAAPGQPTHVLISDEEAEHIPGCNMAFRADVLKAIGGFDETYRKAGDDVDLCWRLIDAGHAISFAPGAFVWHHRRQGARAYFKQQAGYGEAEALLARKHPGRFNVWGAGRWRGELYGDYLSGLRLGGPNIHRGRFGQGLFQTIYHPGPAHWAMLPSTLEWHLAAVVIGLCLPFWPYSWIAALLMLAASLAVAAGQAVQANVARAVDGFRARCVVAGLCWLQPLVRSRARYRTWFRLGRWADPQPATGDFPGFFGTRRVVRFLTDDGVDRAALLQAACRNLGAIGFHCVDEVGWSEDDLKIGCPPTYELRVKTAEEGYGGRSAQVCVLLRLRPKPALWALRAGLLAVLAGAGAAVAAHDPNVAAAVVAAGGATAIVAAMSWSGRSTARRAATAFLQTAEGLGFARFRPTDYRSRA